MSADCFYAGENVEHRRLMCASVKKVGSRFHDLLSESLPAICAAPNACVVVDIESSRWSVATVVSNLFDGFGWVPIVAVTTNADRERWAELYRSGSSDLIVMPQDERVFSQRIDAALRRDTGGNYPPAALRRKFASLTGREREVMRMYLDGQQTKQMAKELGITFQSVDKHRVRSLRKIGVRTLVELQNLIQWATLRSLGFPASTELRTSETMGALVAPHFRVAPTVDVIRFC